MLTIALYLAIIALFFPKKIKPILCNACMVIAGIALVNTIIGWIIGFNFIYRIFGSSIFQIFYDLLSDFNILDIVYAPIWKWAWGFDGQIQKPLFHLLFIFLNLIYYGIYFGLAFLAMKFSIIKYKSDEEECSITEINVDSNTKLVEVSAGLCTGTLRAVAIEEKINEVAKQGWKFEQMETIIGRCCLIFQRYKAVICFSKEE